MKRRFFACILIGVGALAAVVFGLITAMAVASGLRPVTQAQTPSEFSAYLSTGKWELFELTGAVHRTSVGFFSYTAERQSAPDIDSSLITVLDPGGAARPLGDSYGHGGIQTYTRGEDIYTGVASFTAPVAGYYTFSIHSPGPDQVLISRPVLSVITSPLRWFIPAIAGAVLFTIGLVLFIIDLDRRRKDQRNSTNPPYGGYPPGYQQGYPPGYQQGYPPGYPPYPGYPPSPPYPPAGPPG